MASAGYPQSYEKGFPITLPGKDQLIYVAGAKAAEGKLLTNGGRVLGVTETADTLPEAIAKAYEAVKAVKLRKRFLQKRYWEKSPCGGKVLTWFIESMWKKSQGLTTKHEALRNDINESAWDQESGKGQRC